MSVSMASSAEESVGNTQKLVQRPALRGRLHRPESVNQSTAPPMGRNAERSQVKFTSPSPSRRASVHVPRVGRLAVTVVFV